MKKFKTENKNKAVEMHKKGYTSKEIFKKLFPNTNTTSFQKDYMSKTINGWARKNQNKTSKEKNKFKKIQEQIKLLEAEVALLEKESVLFPNLRKEIKLKKIRRVKEKKFEIISKLKKENKDISLKILLNMYSLSFSGYYKYLKEMNKREEKDFNLFLQINEVFLKKKGKKGYRQISMDLGINHKKAYRIMKKYGLKAKIRRMNKSRVTLKRNKENIAVSNILNRKFKQKVPYTFASTDITYLKHQNRFSFLSVTKDLASGEVLSWKLSKDMNLKLVLDAVDSLEKYFKENDLKLNKLLLHSDQGFQYTNISYHSKLKDLKIIQSMSRKGNSVDNAPIESFFGHMKDELDYSDLSFQKLQKMINGYMLEYNYIRKQWDRKKMSPVCYREYLFEKIFA